MKNKSLRFRVNLWYTLLIGMLCILLIVFINFAGTYSQRSKSQQRLISSVEGNVDEIEVENGILDIESDFAFLNGNTSVIVFSDNGEILGGEYPDGMETDAPLSNNNLETVTWKGEKYYLFDRLIEFHKYEFKVNGITGEVISSESEDVGSFTPFDGTLEDTAPECTITYRDAYDAALKYGGFNEEDTTIISASPSKYNNIPLYEIEFHCVTKAHSDIWVRGVVHTNSENDIWNNITIIALLLTPLIMLLGAFVGGKIANAAMKPIKELNDTVSRIESGNDLSQSIEPGDSDPQIEKLADNFNRMFARLRRSFESEKQFTGDASHELRTPLSVILAECDYQLDEDTPAEEAKEGFTTIKSQALSMQKLVMQLLSFTRMEQNAHEIELTECNFSEILADLCDTMESSAKEKEITIHRDIDSDITMNMDISLIIRLCENLISNAIRYGKESGNLTVSLKETDSKVFFKVTDDGVGIAEDQLEKIWNRFYRVDKARSRDEGCCGLGLPMVRQIAQIHGGTAYAESKLGSGSTFTAEFPKK